MRSYRNNLDFGLQMRSIKAIEEGEEVTLNYRFLKIFRSLALILL